MGTAIGSIDARRRPLVRITRVGAAESFLALVDTGFNGDLHMSEGAAARLGFDLRAEKEIVEFADGRREAVRLGYGTIEWLGVPKPVSIFVSPDIAGPRSLRDGDPEALVGTGLLSPNILLMDFDAMSVEIEARS